MTGRDRRGMDVRGMLSRHRPAEPDRRLQARVLEAAVQALHDAAPATLSERIWLSRTWRLGWAAAMAIMLLGQILATGAAERSVRGLPGPQRNESPAVRVARELGLEPAGSMRLTGLRPGIRRPEPFSLPPQE